MNQGDKAQRQEHMTVVDELQTPPLTITTKARGFMCMYVQCDHDVYV